MTDQHNLSKTRTVDCDCGLCTDPEPLCECEVCHSVRGEQFALIGLNGIDDDELRFAKAEVKQ